MRLLLDTQVVVWALAAPERLRPTVRFAIADGATTVAVSAASIWEISIKRAKGRLEISEELIPAIDRLRFETLPITITHADAAGKLPPHHGDPFDRMLIAQAQLEGFAIVTADRTFARYDVPVVEA